MKKYKSTIFGLRLIGKNDYNKEKYVKYNDYLKDLKDCSDLNYTISNHKIMINNIKKKDETIKELQKSLHDIILLISKRGLMQKDKIVRDIYEIDGAKSCTIRMSDDSITTIDEEKEVNDN